MPSSARPNAVILSRQTISILSDHQKSVDTSKSSELIAFSFERNARSSILIDREQQSHIRY